MLCFALAQKPQAPGTQVPTCAMASITNSGCYILSSPAGTLYVGITGFFEQRIHPARNRNTKKALGSYQGTSFSRAVINERQSPSALPKAGAER